ncbi:tyrosine-type recombinase/integrase [Roseomonas stagni]|uniref:Tyrosine-type recombinase/integrase n=1 Tax=Falsiroseomonas algicola TaxID=2716930 RepID=A0A6M1LWW7_9PROT|nr:tyrosine-type recombinase/integrase [Falsiroseomonas algicola]NGM24403.1 tyrosine-type recombinase/integrase [Falsiroseomonas algicola]
MRVTITEAVITDLQRETRTRVLDLWDDAVRGLVLRLLPSGRATWSVRAWTSSGSRTSIKLGEHPALRVVDARRQALIQLGAVQQGRDPVGERRAARDARRAASAAITVENALADWQRARIYTVEDAWSRTYASRVASALRVHIPQRLRGQPLRDVRRETWTGLLAKVAREKPGAGAFLYTAVSSWLGYAEAMGWIETHPLPRRGRKLIAPHVTPRTRVLDDHEWLAVWRAAEREPPKLRAFTRLLLLTACRVSEVADISTGEIVADGAIWVIPGERTKNGREHIVPFEALAQAELRLVWPKDTGQIGDAWRLLGRSPGSGFTGNGKLLRRLVEASGVQHWTWHDLRRTARTGLTYLKVPEPDAEAALNHVSGKGKLVATYDQSGPSASALTALRVWQGYVADVVEGRRQPGDAEAQYRAALPEHLRYRSRPKIEMKKKAKPGRPARSGKKVADSFSREDANEDTAEAIGSD